MTNEQQTVVLVVDDDEDDIFLICDTLGEIEEGDYRIIVSASAPEASSPWMACQRETSLSSFSAGIVVMD